MIFSSMIVSLLLERGRLMNLLLPLVKMCIILIILLISFPIFVCEFNVIKCTKSRKKSMHFYAVIHLSN